jgi:glycosyltransferase involved in cell wall biosynthesis
MRVAIAAFGYGASGMEVGAVDAALGLAERGVHVVLLADAEARLPDRAAPIADCVVRMPPRPWALNGTRREDALFLAAKMWRAREVGRLAAYVRADLVHAYSPGLGARVPSPIRVVAQAWMTPPGLRARLRVMMPFARGGPLLVPVNIVREAQAAISDQLGYRRADLVLAATDGAARALSAAGIRASTVPPPISPPPAPHPRARQSGHLHLAFCGSPVGRPRKGLTYLLDALEHVHVRPLTVTLFGRSDPATDRRAEALRARGVNMRLPGHVPRERYLDALAHDVDALVFTSLFEEWGYAATEALAHGVPVITFDVHPFREVITPRLGVVAGPPGAQALARAIAAAAAGGLPSRDQVHLEAIARFGHRAIAARLVAAYEDVLG